MLASMLASADNKIDIIHYITNNHELIVTDSVNVTLSTPVCLYSCLSNDIVQKALISANIIKKLWYTSSCFHRHILAGKFTMLIR